MSYFKIACMFVYELLSAAISLCEILTVLCSKVLSSYCSVLLLCFNCISLRLWHQISNHGLRTLSGERLYYLKGRSEAEDFRQANVDIKHVIFR